MPSCFFSRVDWVFLGQFAEFFLPTLQGVASLYNKAVIVNDFQRSDEEAFRR